MASNDVPEKGQGSSHNGGTTSDHDMLAQQLTDLARDLHERACPEDVLRTVVHAAIQLIPGVEEGSISVVLGRKDASSRAPSGELPSMVDDIQTELGEG
ncbi:MAG TPA: hypothetical protein VFI97_05140, partial [Arthrobacter sp.]|nr:hypothetical protein [Arthrobacter sp.]